MTTTINDLLFGGRAAARRQLRTPIAAAGTIAAHDAPVGSAVDALTNLFEMPVGNVLLDAWHGDKRVRAACARTLARPRLVESVDLLATDVTCTFEPELDLDAAGRRIVLVKLQLVLALAVDALVLEVAQGSVRAVGPGIATVKAKLTAGGTVLADRTSDKVRIGRAVRLDGAPAPARPVVTTRHGAERPRPPDAPRRPAAVRV